MDQAGGRKDGRVCGQMRGQTPTFFCGPSSVQAEGEDAGSKNTSSERAVGGGEGDQRGGWDRNTSLRALCLCPAIPASRSALLWLLALGSSAPSPNPAHRPAPVGNHQPGQSKWVPITGSWSLPRTTLAWGCSPPGCGLLEGWDGIHPGWDSSLVIQHCQHRAAHLVGVTVGVFF